LTKSLYMFQPSFVSFDGSRSLQVSYNLSSTLFGPGASWFWGHTSQFPMDGTMGTLDILKADLKYCTTWKFWTNTSPEPRLNWGSLSCLEESPLIIARVDTSPEYKVYFMWYFLLYSLKGDVQKLLGRVAYWATNAVVMSSSSEWSFLLLFLCCWHRLGRHSMALGVGIRGGQIEGVEMYLIKREIVQSVMCTGVSQGELQMINSCDWDRTWSAKSKRRQIM
jgi:hypothetical protein